MAAPGLLADCVFPRSSIRGSGRSRRSIILSSDNHSTYAGTHRLSILAFLKSSGSDHLLFGCLVKYVVFVFLLCGMPALI